MDHDTRLEVSSDELKKPLVLDTLREPSHKDIVIDPVEEFLQIKIYHDILLGLLHRLMSALSRSKSITVRRERRA